jgi:hypothetical protein
MTSENRAPINVVTAVGTLDTQLRRGKEQTVNNTWNAVQGRADQIALQVLSPFGVPFRLPIELTGAVAGRDLLDAAPAGTLLAIEGDLEWQMTVDPRYALDATERGRRSSEVQFRAHTIRLATETDELGCDVWLMGTVLTPARILRHPDRLVRIAATTVQVEAERRRAHSRARITERANVAVVVPLDHPDAEQLLRPGNQVLIEGMLERVQVPLSGSEVDRVVAALEQQWTESQERLALKPGELRAAAQAYRKQRLRLTTASRTRIVAGYIELIAGTPATLAETQKLRRERQQERQLAQRTRAAASNIQHHNHASATATVDMLSEPEAAAPGVDSAAGTTRAGRPRRRVPEESSMVEATVESVATDHDPTHEGEI